MTSFVGSCENEQMEVETSNVLGKRTGNTDDSSCQHYDSEPLQVNQQSTVWKMTWKELQQLPWQAKDAIRDLSIQRNITNECSKRQKVEQHNA